MRRKDYKIICNMRYVTKHKCICVSLAVCLLILLILIHFGNPAKKLYRKLHWMDTSTIKYQKNDHTNIDEITRINSTSVDARPTFYWKRQSAMSSTEPTPAKPVTEYYTSRKRLIIIVTYMRSGSSFTGDILQQDPDVFYLFEPFRPLKRKFQKHSQFEFLNGTNSESKQFFRSVVSTIQKISLCDIENIDRSLWKDHPFLSMSRQAVEYIRCLNQKLTKNCLPYLITSCKKSKIILIKTIRIPLSLLTTLMRKFPDMKIVHLMRDPRATLSCISKFGSSKDTKSAKYVSAFCERIHNDVITAKLFQRYFPGRIIRTVYEKLATNTTDITKQLYKFLKLNFTVDIESYIWKTTTKKLKNCTALCTTSDNSARQINKWRPSTSFSLVETFQNYCGYLLNELMLSTIPNERALKSVDQFSLKKIKNEI